MANDFIGIDITGDKELARKLNGLIPEAQDAGVEAASEYLINVLRSYAPYRYVPRAAVYSPAWKSEKQRRFVMAAIRKGLIRIPHRRTQGLAKGWKVIGKGRKSIIVNETPGAQFVVGSAGQQSRHEQAVGWWRFDEVVQERMPRMIDAAVGALKKVLRKRGLKYRG